MTPQDFKDKKITVMGLGLNQGGLGVARWLKKHGAKLTVTDLREKGALKRPVEELEKAPGPHAVRWALGGHRKQDFVSAEMVIKNPAVPSKSEYLRAAREAGTPVESDVSLFFRMCPHPVIGVTGSKGKTTVTLMLGAILREHFGRTVVAGNLGKSPLDALDGLLRRKKAPPVVLELSSWGLETLKSVKRSPEIAVLTNIYREHLNRYPNFKSYIAAKELIFKYQPKDGLALLPYDQETTRAAGARVSGERVWIADKPVPDGQNAVFFRGSSGMIRRKGEVTELFTVRDVKVPGTHNRRNALIAAGTAFLAGAEPARIRAALRGFEGAPHRLERVGVSGGVEYWNDSAATHPEASIAAMRALKKGAKRIVLLAGGADKKLDFSEWAREAGRHCRGVILFEGSATPRMEKALRAAGAPPHAVVGSMSAALYRARLLAKRGDIVLLSPAAASFGLFRNEFDRGDRFRKAVRRMK